MARPKAKTNEMRSSTPRRAYLRSAVLALPQRQRYQNKLASPRELCLRTSRTKNDLINALYREIKLELADAMMSDFLGKKKVGTRLRHVWDRCVNWGIANPKQRKELAQLQFSEVLTKESRDAGSAPFVKFQIMIRDAIEQRVFRNDVPVELISQSSAALVEATIDLTVSNRSKAKQYRDSGFQMFCVGITK